MLSVIIPTLNEAAYLPALLDLLHTSLPTETQIIVSDGGSEDKTVSLAKSYGCDVVISTQRGPAIQRNVGAKKAKGDVLLFLDADTRFTKKVLDISLQEFMKRKLDIASFYFRFDSPQLRYLLLFWYGTVLIYLLHFIHPVALGAAIIVKKSWFETVGGFDETLFMGEDHLIAKSVQDAGGRYGLLNIPGMFFSLRRFHKEGFWTMVYKWHYVAFYYAVHGKFSKPIVPYEFGKYNDHI